MDQFQADAGEGEFSFNLLALHQGTIFYLQTLAEEFPGSVPEQELNSLDSQVVESRLRGKVIAAAAEDLGMPWNRERSFSDAIPGMAIAHSRWAAAVLIVVGAMGWGLSKLLTRRRSDNPQRLGILRHLVAWAVGIGLSFLMFGMIPGSGKGSRLPFVPTFVTDWLEEIFPAGPPITPRGASGLDAELLRIVMQAKEGSWQWRLMQWTVYPGALAAIVLSLALVAGWYAFRQIRRRADGPQALRWWRPARWGGVTNCVSRSAVGAGAVCLAVYLAVAPGVINGVEAEYQAYLQYAVRRHEHWRRMRAAVAAVQADGPRMQGFRAEVQQRIVNEREYDRDRRQSRESQE